MGKQTSGILGKVTGKVGGVIGAAWKSTPYFRAYAKPANPKTPAQMVQRGKMGFVVGIAKLIKATVITPYWNPFQKRMSGYNRFIQKNIKLVADEPAILAIEMSEGDLELGTGILTTSYDSVSGSISITWDDTTMGNGDAEDNAIVVIVDELNNVAFVNALGTRSTTPTELSIGTDRDSVNLHAWLFFSRGTGTSLMVSTSDYSIVSAL
jgi:hypothetical protein